MIESLSKTRPIIFDELPSGSIISKFSNDISILDKSLPETATIAFEGLFYFVNLCLSLILYN